MDIYSLSSTGSNMFNRNSEFVPYGRHASEDHFMQVFSDIYDGIGSKAQQRSTIFFFAVSYCFTYAVINPDYWTPPLTLTLKFPLLTPRGQIPN